MQTEVTVTWRDGDTGLLCKAKDDGISEIGEDVVDLVDLKTTAGDAANPQKMLKKIIEYGYHRQLAFYGDGLEENGKRVRNRIIIAVDTQPPYAVGVYRLTKELLEHGRQQYKDALKDILKYRQSDEPLPAYTNPGMVDLDLPSWLKESTKQTAPTFKAKG